LYDSALERHCRDECAVYALIPTLACGVARRSNKREGYQRKAKKEAREVEGGGALSGFFIVFNF
jgi:hypothetical protein